MDLNIVIDLLCLVILLIIHMWVAMDMMIEHRKKTKMNFCILLVTIALVSEMGWLIFENTIPEYRIISIVANVIYLSVLPFILIVESRFYNETFHKGHFLCLVPASINTLLVFTSPITGWIFTITKDNV